jgi:hypothetical protein
MMAIFAQIKPRIKHTTLVMTIMMFLTFTMMFSFLTLIATIMIMSIILIMMLFTFITITAAHILSPLSYKVCYILCGRGQTCTGYSTKWAKRVPGTARNFLFHNFVPQHKKIPPPQGGTGLSFRIQILCIRS